MSRKPAAKKARRRAPEPEPAGDGMLARVIDRTFENPAMSGGLLVMALTATAIVSNAMFLQRGEHPDPLFMTRGASSHNVESGAEVPAASASSARTDRVIDAPPSPRLSPGHTASIPTIETVMAEPSPAVAVAPPQQAMPAPAPIPPEPLANDASPEVILLTAIQRELARLGLYSGAIDGLMGQRTAAAIAAFETASGMKVTGQPSAALLKAIKQPNSNAVAAPTQTAALPSQEQAAELDRRQQERARMIAEREQSVERSRDAANTRIVQAALNRIGYGPLPVDGATNTDTQDAIRRFELDNGMPVTGSASDALITRLIAIGAVKPG